MVYDDSCMCYGSMRMSSSTHKQYVSTRTFTTPYEDEDGAFCYRVINRGEKYTKVKSKDGLITLSRNKKYQYINIEPHTLANCFEEIKNER